MSQRTSVQVIEITKEDLLKDDPPQPEAPPKEAPPKEEQAEQAEQLGRPKEGGRLGGWRKNEYIHIYISICIIYYNIYIYI